MAKGKKPDGKITAEIGEERKWLFKSALAKLKLTFKEWLEKEADRVIKEDKENK